MAIRQLRIEGDPILRKKCKKVLKIDDRIRLILNDLMDTLHSTDNGAALAANQIGILRRLVVIDYLDYCYKLVNPIIVGKSGEQECLEACLSFPNRLVKTIRPEQVTVQALNEKGETLLLTGEWEMAKCFCHEIEHLDGIVFLDRAIEIIQ